MDESGGLFSRFWATLYRLLDREWILFSIFESSANGAENLDNWASIVWFS